LRNSARTLILACHLAIFAGCGALSGQAGEVRAGADVVRGGEFYRTYCGACHTAQVHWREKRLVKSWDDLRYQVMRWQRIAGQNWSREEIDDVAAYLNTIFYGVPCPLPGCTGSKAGAEGPRLAHQR
jgi:mono/diheme cytochrome c family protein